LKGYEGALVMTSHDREFMNRVVTKIVEIDGGELTVFSGDYEFYARQRAVLDAQAESQFERQQAMLAKEEAFIARFKARASHAAQVQSRVKKLEKIERVEPPRRRKKIRFDFPKPPRSGDDVAALEGVSKAFGRRVVFDGFDLLVRRGERWCVMGANGAGKTTLLKLVAGSSEPDAGRINVAPSVKLGYFAQHTTELLDGDQTVWEALVGKFPRASIGSLHARRRLRLLGRRRREALPHSVGRREGAPRAGADALRPAELLGARRADQPPRSRHQRDAHRGARRVRRHHLARVARPARLARHL
jgi:ATPase subunit of ABC transporter with duplicated ATPase domains